MVPPTPIFLQFEQLLVDSKQLLSPSRWTADHLAKETSLAVPMSQTVEAREGYCFTT